MILNILTSKQHNIHFLSRYIKFINNCIEYNSMQPRQTNVEKHHICPKASDLFPEYTNLTLYTWNSVILTTRQHFIAHWILSKTYKGSQISAFWRMCKNKSKSSKMYETIKESHNLIRKLQIAEKVNNGTYHTQSVEFKSLISKTQTEKALNNELWIQSKIGREFASINQQKLVAAGLHHTQTIEHSINMTNFNNDRVSNGTHPFLYLDKKPWASEQQTKLFKDGLHPFQKIDMTGEKHHLAKKYKIESNSGEIFIINGGLVAFCKTHNISFSALYATIGKDIKVSNIKNMNKSLKDPIALVKRTNAIGWKISKL